MKRGETKIASWLNENIFFIISVLFVLSVPFSESFISITSGLIALQLFYPPYFKKYAARFVHDKSLWALMAVYLLFIIGYLFCDHPSEGLYELRKNMFWVIIPPGMALTRKLTEKQFWIVVFLFVFAVSVGAVIASVKVLLFDKLQLDNVRDATYISNIIYSLQVVFSFFILIYARLTKKPVFRNINWFVIVVWGIWLFVFLNIQKSLTGLVAFVFTAFVFLIWFIKQSKTKKSRLAGLFFIIALFIVPAGYISYVALNFYNVKDEMPSKTVKTENGNEYRFDFNNTMKENGHFVYWYICDEELGKAWNSVSEYNIHDKNDDGYIIYSTLIRYLTSKGLRKDSAGVAALSQQDIKNIEHGFSNYIFYEKRFSLYPRVYETIWEIDKYITTNDPNNQSLSQRIEYTRAAIFIIKNNPLGVGTGNARPYYKEAYDELGSNLDEKFQYLAHNQYLTYMVRFGVPGFVVILLLLFYAVKSKDGFHIYALVLLLSVFGMAGFGENVLENHSGLSLFLFFLSLFLWHYPQKRISN
jgi:putative effector of murein hydrolase LrgA (UPF0299 family)/Ca2+/Na+ antiporter